MGSINCGADFNLFQYLVSTSLFVIFLSSSAPVLKHSIHLVKKKIDIVKIPVFFLSGFSFTESSDSWDSW